MNPDSQIRSLQSYPVRRTGRIFCGMFESRTRMSGISPYWHLSDLQMESNHQPPTTAKRNRTVYSTNHPKVSKTGVEPASLSTLQPQCSVYTVPPLGHILRKKVESNHNDFSSNRLAVGGYHHQTSSSDYRHKQIPDFSCR